MGRVLVTGASGFVGSRLVRALIDRGEQVKALVRPGSSLKQLSGYSPKQLELAIGDIMVEHTVYAALADCDRLYHVASNFRMWASNPDDILGPAVAGTRSTLEAARRRGLEKIVVTSSVAALGTEGDRAAMDEGHEFNLPDAETYVLSKYRAEQVAHEMIAEGLPAVVVLPTGIFGPGDWKPTPSGAGVLEYMTYPTWLKFPVTGGGMNIVDVDDVVAGHILAMEKGRIGERYILGGDNVTFEEMFGILAEHTGLSTPGLRVPQGVVALTGGLMELAARFTGADPTITRRLARDYAFRFAWITSEKAEKELGYEHRSAKKALERSVAWFLEHGYVPEATSRRLRLELRPT